jgi:hypothetical protein
MDRPYSGDTYQVNSVKFTLQNSLVRVSCLSHGFYLKGQRIDGFQGASFKLSGIGCRVFSFFGYIFVTISS